jgi:hypothetical protein
MMPPVSYMARSPLSAGRNRPLSGGAGVRFVDYKVFIQTNDEQYLGALVAGYALKRNSRFAEKFGVEIMHRRDYPWLDARIGQAFLRGAERRAWQRDDLQSFTPLRFMPPALMDYRGRSVVIDPDCFAIGDIWDLFSRDMGGKAIMCRIRPALKDLPPYRASSVMLLDNSKLRHWNAERMFGELFEFKRDYMKWIKLEYEKDETVGILEPEWNDFDRLTPDTKILHTTYRRTQPWKTGLPIDFTVRAKPEKRNPMFPMGVIKRLKRALTGRDGRAVKDGYYQPHPDRNQEKLFFSLVGEMLEKGIIAEDLLRREMASNHVRHDALDLCRKVAA